MKGRTRLGGEEWHVAARPVGRFVTDAAPTSMPLHVEETVAAFYSEPVTLRRRVFVAIVAGERVAATIIDHNDGNIPAPTSPAGRPFYTLLMPAFDHVILPVYSRSTPSPLPNCTQAAPKLSATSICVALSVSAGQLDPDLNCYLMVFGIRLRAAALQ